MTVKCASRGAPGSSGVSSAGHHTDPLQQCRRTHLRAALGGPSLCAPLAECPPGRHGRAAQHCQDSRFHDVGDALGKGSGCAQGWPWEHSPAGQQPRASARTQSSPFSHWQSQPAAQPAWRSLRGAERGILWFQGRGAQGGDPWCAGQGLPPRHTPSCLLSDV